MCVYVCACLSVARVILGKGGCSAQAVPNACVCCHLRHYRRLCSRPQALRSHVLSLQAVPVWCACDACLPCSVLLCAATRAPTSRVSQSCLLCACIHFVASNHHHSAGRQTCNEHFPLTALLLYSVGRSACGNCLALKLLLILVVLRRAACFLACCTVVVDGLQSFMGVGCCCCCGCCCWTPQIDVSIKLSFKRTVSQ